MTTNFDLNICICSEDFDKNQLLSIKNAAEAEAERIVKEKENAAKEAARRDVMLAGYDVQNGIRLITKGMNRARKSGSTSNEIVEIFNEMGIDILKICQF